MSTAAKHSAGEFLSRLTWNLSAVNCSLIWQHNKFTANKCTKVLCLEVNESCLVAAVIILSLQKQRLHANEKPPFSAFVWNQGAIVS